jgi:hypothetical protein
VHIMAVHWTEAMSEIVTRAGLYPRPTARLGAADSPLKADESPP